MLKCFWAIIFTLSTALQLNAATVRINTASAPVVQLITASTYTLVVDSPSGDGTSEAAPAKVYVPIQNNLNADASLRNTEYSTYTPRTNLPTGDPVGSITGTLRVSLDTSGFVAGDFLHVAIKDSSSSVYKVLKNQAIAGDEVGKIFDFTVASMCSAGAGDLDCTGIINTANPTSVLDGLVYFFIGSQEGNGNTIDPSAKAGGVFYNIFLSNRIYTNTITLGSLTKGDSRLTAVYQGFNFENLNNIVAFDFGANGCETIYGTAALLGTSYITEQKATSGEAAIKNLVNDTSYKFAVYFEDKFKFSSLLSNCLTGTPQKIEALLEKNACFMLTAGFGGDHFIVDYFRQWRDEFLLSFSLGRMFVEFYYDWGPKLAPYILESPYLSKIIRGGAYAVYWTLEFKLWGVLVFFILALVFLKRRDRLN